jgi:hypothetical protein
VAHCADFAVAVALASAGHGVTLVPSIAAPTAAGDHRPIRLLHTRHPHINRTLYAAIRHGTHQHPLIHCLLDALSSSARHHGARTGDSDVPQLAGQPVPPPLSSACCPPKGLEATPPTRNAVKFDAWLPLRAWTASPALLDALVEEVRRGVHEVWA